MRFTVISTSKLKPIFVPIAASAILATGLGATAPAAHAQALYLVGAELYSATSTGADANTGYLYSTNTSTTNVYALELVLNGTTYDKGIAIQLASGANTFTINTSPQGAVNPGPYAGLGLFFSTTPTSYNPSATTQAPDLVFSSSVGTGTSGDFIPAASTAVASYNFNGTSTTNGAASVQEGSYKLSVSNFAVTSNANGSFTINAAAGAPEPTAAMLVLAGTPLLVSVVRHRSKRRQASAI